NLIKSENLKGPYQFHIRMNADRDMIESETWLWDGKTISEEKSRMQVKPGYPVWDGNSIAFLGSRYLDLDSKGLAYLVQPGMVKEPMPFMANLIKTET